MKNKLKLILFIMFLSTLSACKTNPNISRDLTAGQIGCSPDEIGIENETARFSGTHTWTAICKGEQYICSYHSTTGTKCTLKK